MAKLLCLTLEGGLIQSNTYKTPKGNTYRFTRRIEKEISDKDDYEYFKNCGHGKFFKEVGIVETVKEAVKKITKIEEKKVPTEEELFKLNKKEQTELIKRLGGVNSRIPSKEIDRVAMILKLQAS